MKSRLKVLLAEKGMTQGELCEALNINEHTISAIALAKVKKFDVKKLQLICEFFNCNIQDVIYFEKSA